MGSKHTPDEFSLLIFYFWTQIRQSIEILWYFLLYVFDFCPNQGPAKKVRYRWRPATFIYVWGNRGVHTLCAWDAARDSTCMHGRISWPAVSKELLAAKYGRVAPRCQTVWPFCWPQTTLRQQRSTCLLCKTEPAPEVPHLTQALLSRF